MVPTLTSAPVVAESGTPAPPSLSLCLSLLLPSVNVTELMHKIGVNLPLDTLLGHVTGESFVHWQFCLHREVNEKILRSLEVELVSTGFRLWGGFVLQRMVLFVFQITRAVTWSSYVT